MQTMQSKIIFPYKIETKQSNKEHLRISRLYSNMTLFVWIKFLILAIKWVKFVFSKVFRISKMIFLRSTKTYILAYTSREKICGFLLNRKFLGWYCWGFNLIHVAHQKRLFKAFCFNFIQSLLLLLFIFCVGKCWRDFNGTEWYIFEGWCWKREGLGKFSNQIEFTKYISK